MDLGFTLAPGETVIRKINRHWIALAPVVAAAAIIVVAVIAMTYLFGRYRSDFPSSFTAAGMAGVAGIALVLAFLLLYGGFWVYRRNFLVLTNQHLVRVEQKGLFARSVSQLSLSRVQDVSGAVSGFLPTVLGFGDITVETAGAEDNFVFTTVPRPSEMSAACLKAHEEFAPRDEDTPMRPAQPPAPTEMATPATVASPPPGMVEEVIYVPEPVPSPKAVEPPVPQTTQNAPLPMEESVTETIAHNEDNA
jgi:uncharacterized membrane protein YdbT with pleckstrin-like domain